MDHGRILECGAPQALIRQYIEPPVVEIFDPELETWHRTVGAFLAERSERVGETLLYHTQQERPLMEQIERCPDLTYLHRPANLEDVFIRLTGRELRDG
jgi:lipooligosaccharide transport system ATP-binding protein